MQLAAQTFATLVLMISFDNVCKGTHCWSGWSIAEVLVSRGPRYRSPTNACAPVEGCPRGQLESVSRFCHGVYSDIHLYHR
jgi:hypothetical protein